VRAALLSCAYPSPSPSPSPSPNPNPNPDPDPDPKPDPNKVRAALLSGVVGRAQIGAPNPKP
jgi:hypothetical protein